MAETCGMAVCTSSGARSERFLQLNVEDKKRYIAKLSLIDGIDPYLLSDRDRLFGRHGSPSITELSDCKIASTVTFHQACSVSADLSKIPYKSLTTTCTVWTCTCYIYIPCKRHAFQLYVYININHIILVVLFIVMLIVLSIYFTLQVLSPWKK